MLLSSLFELLLSINFQFSARSEISTPPINRLYHILNDPKFSDKRTYHS
jgi:hypothetical protein